MTDYLLESNPTCYEDSNIEEIIQKTRGIFLVWPLGR